MVTAAKLIDLGYPVAVPLVDDGDFIDLIAAHRVTVQVKTKDHQHPNGGYGFNYQDRSRPGGTTDDLDVIICWGRETDQWWVIPKERLDELGHVSVITLSPNPRYNNTRFAQLNRDCIEAWHLIDEIADRRRRAA